ncbi:MAG: hypothetical protein V1703_02090 [Candidatus Altiarchaeota archaeon]
MEIKPLRLFLILMLLSNYATAWGDETQKYICEKVVQDVWGSQVLNQCFVFNKTLQYDLCDELRQKAGQEVYLKCVQETDNNNHLHPALVPYALFNDSEKHVDYSICHVKGTVNSQLICGDPSETPAVEKSEEWFTSATNADSECMRVIFFCIGSNYYSDSKFKLNNMKNLEKCNMDVEKKADEEVTSRIKWQFEAYCAFDGWVQRVGRTVREMHAQNFMFSSDDIDQITESLRAKAIHISSTPLPKYVALKSRTTTTTLEIVHTVQTDITTPTTNTPVNESEIVYNQISEDYLRAIDEGFSFLDIIKGNNTGTAGETRGRGNTVVKAFMVLFIVFGFLFAAFVLAKIELKRYRRADKPPQAQGTELREESK